MTYKTRQEVLRAAADWIDVCEAAGAVAMCKYGRYVYPIEQCSLGKQYSNYEFPIALLEGKEVWVGSELYHNSGCKYTVQEIETFSDGRRAFRTVRAPWVDGDYIENYSWNPPKPKTVMVEMLVEDVKFWNGQQFNELGGKLPETSIYNKASNRFYASVKKALEKLK